MSEDEAREWVRAHFGADANGRLERFGAMLTAAAIEQNLIARDSLAHLWTRHLVDSAQLAMLSSATGIWLDIGTGGGLPGLVLALLLERGFVLCEPRRLRAAFLRDCSAAFGIQRRVTVAELRVERLTIRAETISARAVAGIDKVLTGARHCASSATEWILPRGQSGHTELGESSILRPGMFHVKHSVTDPAAMIVVAQGVPAS